MLKNVLALFFILVFSQALFVSPSMAADDDTIFQAAENGDLDRVKALLKGNPRLVNAKDEQGRTPLIAALYVDCNEDVAEFLIAKGADVKARDSAGNSVLYYAARKGSKKMVQLLAAKGADIKAKDKYGSTMLHWAASGGSVELAEYLVSKGLKITDKDEDGDTPVLHAYSEDIRGTRTYDPAMIGFFLDKGADINLRDKEGETLLHHAAASGRTSTVELLLKRGARVNIVDEEGTTALDLVCSKTHILDSSAEIVQLLTKYGAKSGKDLRH